MMIKASLAYLWRQHAICFGLQEYLPSEDICGPHHPWPGLQKLLLELGFIKNFFSKRPGKLFEPS
jgi:hypothetical protein